MPAQLLVRQHEVQAVAGPGGRVAAAWADDTKTSGMSGWTCGYSVSLDRGRSWSAPLFHRRAGFAVTANPTIAMDPRGVVFGVAMSVEDDYGSGILELSSSTDAGGSWTAWRTLVSKRNGIPDRPKLMAAANGDLHLVFSNIERTGRSLKVLKSTIQHTRSTDHGQTWSEPRTISVGRQRSRWLIDGYQGPAIAEAPNGELLVSWADYYGNGMSFSISRNAGVDFDKPVWVRLKALPGTSVLTWLLGATFGTPVTELAVDATARNLLISVHEAHAMGEIVLVGSQDGGRTWGTRRRLTTCGTNASFAFDSTGRLHLIWTELRDQRVDLLYATSSDFGHSLTTAISLAGNGAPVEVPKSTEDREECKAALGSYQSLVIDGDGTASAFWVDLRKGLANPSLYQSTWQVAVTASARMKPMN
jgi:BNR repeat-like domain